MCFDERHITTAASGAATSITFQHLFTLPPSWRTAPSVPSSGHLFRVSMSSADSSDPGTSALVVAFDVPNMP
jgi:hypothetical protein